MNLETLELHYINAKELNLTSLIAIVFTLIFIPSRASLGTEIRVLALSTIYSFLLSIYLTFLHYDLQSKL